MSLCDTGAFITLGVCYFVAMAAGALGARVPHPQWKPTSVTTIAITQSPESSATATPPALSPSPPSPSPPALLLGPVGSSSQPSDSGVVSSLDQNYVDHKYAGNTGPVNST